LTINDAALAKNRAGISVIKGRTALPAPINPPDKNGHVRGDL
jgi:hypothetical protein